MPDILYDESIDDLQLKGLKIIQKKTGFKFGIDAVLLSSFAEVKKGDHAVDLGTGCGIVPILLAGKTEASCITGVEIQEDIVEMANRSISINNLNNRVKVICKDVRNLNQLIEACSVDVVTVNPPYINSGCGLLNTDNKKSIARHEIHGTLEDFIKEAARILKHGACFYMVHRPDRLADIICTMRKHKLEPKLLKLVSSSFNKKPVLLLIKGLKNGNAQLTVSETLYVYNKDGSYTEEVKGYYDRDRRV